MEKFDENLGSKSHEPIDLAEYAKMDKQVPIGRKYQVLVDHDHLVFDHHIVTGKEVLEKAGRVPTECFSLYLKLKHHDFELITLNQEVDLTTEPGIEHFITKPPIVFQYFIDDEPETTEDHQLTPNQILELAGILPVEDYYLVQILPDGTQVSYKDTPNIPITMKCPAMKFVSIFRGETPVS